MATLTETFQQILHLNAGTAEILASLVLFALVAFVGWGSYLVFNRYFSKWAAKTTTTLDDDILSAVKIIIVIMIAVIGIEYALQPLSILQPYSDTVSGICMVLEILLGAYAVTRVSNIVADWYASRTALIAGKNSHHLLFILKKVIQIIVYVAAFLFILWMFNVDLTGAMVGLGVGGIAIAFALQSTLSDFFSAFSIYFDRPFEIGDFIVVGEYSGTVKNIGIRSTRLQLLQGEELVISNKELTSGSVRNFRKLQKRRIVFTIGVTYDTSSEKLQKIPLILRGIIENTANAEIERVHFTEFGDFALKFQVSYYVKVPDYGVYLDIQQAINFAIKEVFEKEGIEMAFPTSTVYLKK
ncbi:MAG: mechanosensitive ion channel family protein [Candidatus Bathyarchaeota archaeon]|nr:mechanosensitive ion channel family protein [Candidatus Bathyarchaeota archaeon]